MRRFYLIGFLLLASLDTAAQICFKFAAIRAAPLEPEAAWVWRLLITPWMYGAIVCYVGTFFVWIRLLRDAPIGTAFAISHLDVIGVLIASILVFNERILPSQGWGALLIVSGIACLAVDGSRQQKTQRRLDPATRDC
jgi:drug/metabolite transporter (DMT)-like permease